MPKDIVESKDTVMPKGIILPKDVGINASIAVSYYIDRGEIMSKNIHLSEDLKNWRADRPDEWTMDRFIRKATLLEGSATGYLTELCNVYEEIDRLKAHNDRLVDKCASLMGADISLKEAGSQINLELSLQTP